jgi:hypothetical protein
MDDRERRGVVRPLHAVHRHDGGRCAIALRIGFDDVAIAMREKELPAEADRVPRLLIIPASPATTASRGLGTSSLQE